MLNRNEQQSEEEEDDWVSCITSVPITKSHHQWNWSACKLSFFQGKATLKSQSERERGSNNMTHHEKTKTHNELISRLDYSGSYSNSQQSPASIIQDVQVKCVSLKRKMVILLFFFFLILLHLFFKDFSSEFRFRLMIHLHLIRSEHEPGPKSPCTHLSTLTVGFQTV